MKMKRLIFVLFLSIFSSTNIPTNQPTEESTIALPPTQEISSISSYNKDIKERIEILAIITSSIGVIVVMITIIHYIIRYQIISSFINELYPQQEEEQQQKQEQEEGQSFSLSEVIRSRMTSIIPSISWKRCHLTLAEIEYQNMIIEYEREAYEYNLMRYKDYYGRYENNPHFNYENNLDNNLGVNEGETRNIYFNNNQILQNDNNNNDDDVNDNNDNNGGKSNENRDCDESTQEFSVINEGKYSMPSKSQVVIGTQINSI